MTPSAAHRAAMVAAFAESNLILALENLVEPAGYAQLRQEVIESKLTIAEAVAQLLREAQAKG